MNPNARNVQYLSWEQTDLKFSLFRWNEPNQEFGSHIIRGKGGRIHG